MEVHCMQERLTHRCTHLVELPVEEADFVQVLAAQDLPCKGWVCNADEVNVEDSHLHAPGLRSRAMMRMSSQ